MTKSKHNLKDIQPLARLTHGKEYQAWLKEESNSSALLVEGGREHPNIFTPLSYLCALIVQEYRDTDNIFVLSYFGGIRDQQANPTDMLCQMLGQLLTYKFVASVYLRNPIEHELKDKIKRKDFKTLLEVFLKLIKQLESYKRVIFCIIDSVTMIERGKQKKDAQELILALNTIVRGQRGRARKPDTHLIFKLLATENATCLAAQSFFRQKDRIILSQEIFDKSIHSDLFLRSSSS